MIKGKGGLATPHTSQEEPKAPVNRLIIPGTVTPVRHQSLNQYLSAYDPFTRNYLVKGFRYGFSLGCTSIPPSKSGIVQNLKSALEQPDVVRKKIDKELSLARIIGPFDTPPDAPNYRISPLGVVPKKVPGEYRMIHHLSYPHGDSVNDSIPPENSKVQYASIQDAISFIKRNQSEVTGPLWLGKMDVESAFRLIPIHPNDRPLLGFHFEGKFYFDAVLPMGCASSCQIFETFSTALEWIAMQKLGASRVFHVVDDFLFIADSAAKCDSDMNAFQSLCTELGVPLAAEKTMGPLNVLPFLGITLDTKKLEARLPEDKLEQCREQIIASLRLEKITLRGLQSVIGLLNFACSVVVPGRCFLRRLIDLTMGVRKPTHFIRLTKEVKLDLQTWLSFLQNYNGASFFIDENFLTGNYLSLYTDSSKTIGWGAVYGKKWFYGQWPHTWRSYNIATLELYPIVLALATWGHSWKNRSVCFYTDNQALIPVINKQTSKDKQLMGLVRKLVFICLEQNIVFTARHIPGRFNILSDCLSRFQVEKFRRKAPWANPEPSATPEWMSPATLKTL